MCLRLSRLEINYGKRNVTPDIYCRTNKALSSSSKNALITEILHKIQSANASVLQFPNLTQMALGGAPCRKLNWWKSASWEMMQKIVQTGVIPDILVQSQSQPQSRNVP
jgi:hypothetical protein